LEAPPRNKAAIFSWDLSLASTPLHANNRIITTDKKCSFFLFLDFYLILNRDNESNYKLQWYFARFIAFIILVIVIYFYLFALSLVGSLSLSFPPSLLIDLLCSYNTKTSKNTLARKKMAKLRLDLEEKKILGSIDESLP
jgi:hypothetical protein